MIQVLYIISVFPVFTKCFSHRVELLFIELKPRTKIVSNGGMDPFGSL